MLKKVKKSIKKFNNEIDCLRKDGVLEYGRIYYFMDECICFLKYGSSPNDYVHMRMYKKSREERRKLFTFKKFVKYREQLNQGTLKERDLIDNKAKFNRHMADFIKRDWIFSKEASADELCSFFEKHDEIILKPLREHGGSGIEKLKVSTENLEKIRDLKESGAEFLLEEVIKQHKVINEINPYAVSTVRVYTVRGDDGKIHIPAVYIRVASKKTFVDNFSKGGVAFPVDTKTGVIYKPGQAKLESQRIIIHPLTGKTVPGIKIPYFEDIKKNAEMWCKKFPEFRYLGWDIAITEDGIDIVEANLSPGNTLLEQNDEGNFNKIRRLALKNK